MENWLFLFLGLILAYLLDFTKPWVKSAYERSVFSSRKKRIESLISDYKHIKSLRGDFQYLGVVTLKGIVSALLELAMLVVLIGVNLLTSSYLGKLSLSNYALSLLVMLQIMFFIYSGLTQARDRITNAISFAVYKEKTIKKLIKLGGSPEDLDKE